MHLELHRKFGGRLAFGLATGLLLLGSAAARADDPHAQATVESDAGKVDLGGVKGLALASARKPLTARVVGPGDLTLGLRARSKKTRFELFLDGKRAKEGELAGGEKEAAGAEQTVKLDVAGGEHTLRLVTKGGEVALRIIAPLLDADLALTLPDMNAKAPDDDLPIEEVQAKAPEKTASPTAVADAKPAAAAPAPVAPAPAAAETSDAWRVRLQPFAAVGSVSELGFSSPMLPGLGAASSQFQVGAFATVTRGPLSIVTELRDGFYHRDYVTRWGAPSGKLPTLALDEQNLAFGSTVGFDVVHLLSPSLAERLTVSPFAGPAARMLLNDAVPQNIVGIEVGGRVEWAASPSVALSASGGWLGNWSFIKALDYSGVPLLLGAPQSATDVRVEARVKLSGPTDLRLAWDQEVLALQLAYRSYQSLSVAFDYGF